MSDIAAVSGDKCRILDCENTARRDGGAQSRFCSIECVDRWLSDLKIGSDVDDEVRRERHVYFLECELSGRVKIGITDNVARRIRDIQSMSPTTLRLIGSIVGTGGTEAAWHQRWGKMRLHGEWFRLSPTLRLAIKKAIESDNILRFPTILPDRGA